MKTVQVSNELSNFQRFFSGLFAAVVFGLMVFTIPVVTNATNARTAKFVDIKLLPNTKQSWIAKRMTIDGVPTSIRLLENNKPLELVVDYYLADWKEHGKVVQRTHGEWQILFTKKKDNFISLHLKSKGNGTEGKLLISGDPQRYTDNARTSLPLSPAFKILSRQEHLDGSSKAESITMSSPDAVTTARAGLVSSLTADGWKTVYDEAAKQTRNAYSLQLTKSQDVIKVFIGADPKWSEDTLILLTWQKHRR